MTNTPHGDPARHALYLAFEGVEGCGKSTQARRLAARLDAVLTREPGGTTIGNHIRDLVQNDPTLVVDPRTEALLFAADRAQHVTEIVAPALAAGRHVVSDRSVWSSVAYQGAGRGLGMTDILGLGHWATRGLLPGTVILIDGDPDLFAARRAARSTADRIERSDRAFFDRVTDGFRRLAADHDWIVVDGTGTPDDVEAAVNAALGVSAGAR